MSLRSLLAGFSSSFFGFCRWKGGGEVLDVFGEKEGEIGCF